MQIITNKQKFGVIIDNSMSMQKIINSDKELNIDEIILKIENWSNNNNIDLNYVINFAYNNGVGSLIVEGGKNLTQSFVSKKIVLQ